MHTLKHLARDVDMDPYRLRMSLRALGLKPLVNGRWKWESEEDPNYKKARDLILESRSKNSSTNSSGTPDKLPTAPSRTDSSGRKGRATSRPTASNS